MTLKSSKSWPIGLVAIFIKDNMKRKYVEVGGPTDAELKKIEKESKDVYTMPLKDLFKVDEDLDVEVQDTADY